jgi:signal transduction histidine kinase
MERIPVSRSEAIVASAAIGAAAVAVWLTLSADFLAHPGWLAVQKADMILGPVLTGLYWRRRRPQSRFASLLIAVGFLHVPYILQSSSAPFAFSFGVIWEGVIYVITLALILAFPTGRLDGPVVRALLAAGIIGTGFGVVIVMVAPAIGADGSISGCRAACPENGLFVSANVPLALRLIDVNRAIIVTNAIVTLALIVHRFAAGTPPRRRALAIGAPIAIFFLVTQMAYQGANLVGFDTGPLHTAAQWAIVVSRSTLWYGFLLALVAGELFAGRVLRRLVQESLQRPQLDELEAMLKGPLGDPGLRLAFWRPDRGGWGDDGDFAPDPSTGRVLTVIERDGRPAVAIDHDPELAADPELVQAAGAVALLAQENAQLEAAWSDSLRELRDSRARIAAAGDVERRALERDLHDGAQQQLTAILLKLSMVRDLVDGAAAVQSRITELEGELEGALEELRRLGHGIYPAPLAETGIVGALEAVASRSPETVDVSSDGVDRYSSEVESAVYFCCLEALQNATKHAGPGVRISIQLYVTGRILSFRVSDDGAGFEPLATHVGVGLRNMHDRLEAFDGRLEITSAPGRGTAISGALPVV